MQYTIYNCSDYGYNCKDILDIFKILHTNRIYKIRLLVSLL